MFDIGFFEILVIAVVGLVVIGPERLPDTVRSIGLWVGRLKRSLRETRSEIEKQIGADDIRRQLHNEDVMRSLENSRRQVQDALQEGALPHRSKRQYQEEEELPDHAHGDDASSAQEPSANKEPSAEQEPSANKEPSAGQEPSAHKEPSAGQKPSAEGKKPSAKEQTPPTEPPTPPEANRDTASTNTPKAPSDDPDQKSNT